MTRLNAGSWLLLALLTAVCGCRKKEQCYTITVDAVGITFRLMNTSGTRSLIGNAASSYRYDRVRLVKENGTSANAFNVRPNGVIEFIPPDFSEAEYSDVHDRQFYLLLLGETGTTTIDVDTVRTLYRIERQVDCPGVRYLLFELYYNGRLYYSGDRAQRNFEFYKQQP